MKIQTDLPDVIPVFPLPGAMLLPRTRLPLHIFEPRYLQMLEDTMKTTHRLIGMIQPRDVPGGASQFGGARLHSIGCAGRLTGFSETEDGRYMITLSGVSRFRVLNEVQGFTAYRRATVDWAPFHRDIGGVESDPDFDRDEFIGLLARYFEAMDMASDWGSLREADEELLINSLSMLCPFAHEDKQALLEAQSLIIRRETLVTLIKFTLHGGSGEETMQ